MRTTYLSLLSISAIALSVAACGGSIDDADPNGGGTGTEDTGGTGGAGGDDISDQDAGDTDDDAGAGGSGGSGGAGGGDSGPGAPTISFACPGGTIEDGSNTMTVDGKERTFFADFPSDTTAPLGVVFSWHGFGDNATNYRAAMNLDPDADPAQPVVILTPEDTNMQPPTGLGWDIRAGKPGDSNVDLPFFEAMLGCLNEQHSIDAARVYSVGFSAGSVFTALLHSRYPELFAATVHQSGAWMNDPEQTKLVQLLQVDWSWPDLDPTDEGNVLLTHGGPTDVVGAMGFTVFNLEDSAQAALPFLAAGQRTVVDCAHDKGHVLHPELTPAMVVKYLTAHRAGEPSPYADGTFEGYPDSCTLLLP